jgi:hypothetical protein
MSKRHPLDTAPGESQPRRSTPLLPWILARFRLRVKSTPAWVVALCYAPATALDFQHGIKGDFRRFDDDFESTMWSSTTRGSWDLISPTLRPLN